MSFARDPLFWLTCIGIAIAAAGLATLPSQTLQPHWPAWQTIWSAVVLAPVVEEIIFRGGLQHWLLRRCHGQALGLSVANILTSIPFALVHLWMHPPVWALATGAPSLLFGAFYERHDRRLSAPIMLHGLANAAYFCLLGP